MMSDITVVVPTIPPRADKLRRALESIIYQQLRPRQIIIQVDHDHEGAAITRNRALFHVETKYTAFLDDDDYMLPHHLEELRKTAEEEKAQLVYSKCHWTGEYGEGIFATPSATYRHDLPFDGNILLQNNFIPVTTLVDTDMAQMVGGFQYPENSNYEDWGLWLAMYNAGAKFVHLPKKTWLCYRGRPSQHTAGLGENW